MHYWKPTRSIKKRTAELGAAPTLFDRGAILLADVQRTLRVTRCIIHVVPTHREVPAALEE